MAKRYEYIFEVEGTTLFPVDMLRYDRCWPEQDRDAVALAAAVRGSRTGHTIRLRSAKPPTPGRWVSFGWPMVFEADKQVVA